MKDPNPSLAHKSSHSYEIKLSNTSDHKKRRGLLRRINQRKHELDEQRALRGLTSYQIIQNDSGANRCITNEKGILLKFTNIPALPIGDIDKDQLAFYGNGHGLLSFRSDNGDILLIPCLYCKDAE